MPASHMTVHLHCISWAFNIPFIKITGLEEQPPSLIGVLVKDSPNFRFTTSTKFTQNTGPQRQNLKVVQSDFQSPPQHVSKSAAMRHDL